MICSLILTLASSGLTYHEIPLSPTFKLRAPYLRAEQVAPTGGFLVPKGDIAHIKTELGTADSACDVRLTALQEAADGFLLETQQRQERRVADYVVRIDELQLERDYLDSQLKSEIRKGKTFRLMSYITAGVLVSAVGYLAISK